MLLFVIAAVASIDVIAAVVAVGVAAVASIGIGVAIASLVSLPDLDG